MPAADAVEQPTSQQRISRPERELRMETLSRPERELRVEAAARELRNEAAAREIRNEAAATIRMESKHAGVNGRGMTRSRSALSQTQMASPTPEVK